LLIGIASADVSSANVSEMPTLYQAFKAVQEIELPSNVKPTGSTEPI
jgi:hypothetical protein